MTEMIPILTFLFLVWLALTINLLHNPKTMNTTHTKIVWKYNDGKYYKYCGESLRAIEHDTTSIADANDFSDYWDPNTNTMTVPPPDRCGRDPEGKWVKVTLISSYQEIQGDNPTGPERR